MNAYTNLSRESTTLKQPNPNFINYKIIIKNKKINIVFWRDKHLSQ